jgi:hypothetical protein
MTGAIGLAVPDVHAATRLTGHSAVHAELVSPGNCPYRPAGQAVLVVGFRSVESDRHKSIMLWILISCAAGSYSYSPRDGTHGRPVIAAWTLRAVGYVGLGTAGEAIPTLRAIGARVELVCIGFVCTHGALVAAFRGGILEEASVAFDGVLPSRNGTCNTAQ